MDGFSPFDRYNHNDVPLIPATTGDWPNFPEVTIYGEDIPVPDTPAGAADMLNDIDTSDLGTGYDTGDFDYDTYGAEIEDYIDTDPYGYPDNNFGSDDAEIPDDGDDWGFDSPLAERLFGGDDSTDEVEIVDAGTIHEATDKPTEVTETDYGEAPTEVENLYQTLQDRLATEEYTDDGHYLEVDTPSGSVVVSDRLRYEHTGQVDAYLEAETAGHKFNPKVWSESLLKDHASILCVTIQDGPLDDVTTNETEEYIIARPCDLNTEEEDSVLGSLIAETLAEQAPGITMDSTTPIMLNIMGDPTRIFTGIGHDPILEELYNLLRQ